MSTSKHPFFLEGLQIPRFLFRGFNKYSGGGLPGQNTTEGITPRGFLLGYDTEKEISSSMDPWRVKARVESHCCQKDSPPTPFSSWSHDWRLALNFSVSRLTETKENRRLLKEEDYGFIAVLDTWALQDESTWAVNVRCGTEFSTSLNFTSHTYSCRLNGSYGAQYLVRHTAVYHSPRFEKPSTAGNGLYALP